MEIPLKLVKQEKKLKPVPAGSIIALDQLPWIPLLARGYIANQPHRTNL
jgi:hypothetical protein